jgi:hypothetical protein
MSGKNQFIANVSHRFADFRQLTKAAIIHTKRIFIVLPITHFDELDPDCVAFWEKYEFKTAE